MKHLLIASLLFLCQAFIMAQTDEQIIKTIYQEELSNSPVYEDLRFLTKEIGNRINGSPELAGAVEYTKALMTRYQFDTVYLEPVKVPNWKREKNEIVKIINSPTSGGKLLNCIALGNSVGTGEDGITGEVIEINGIEELQITDRNLIEGKIVFLNKPFDKSLFRVLEGYANAVNQRVSGASKASEKGAIAVIVRSVTPGNTDTPHTGNMFYAEGIPKIPVVAVSTNDADVLSASIKQEPGTEVYMEIHCTANEDADSYNVIGEIKGNQYEDQIILVGGHLDSWDVGEGAQDDGAGCVQSIEVARLFNALDIEPRHTIRVVLWVNEENGLSGAAEYAENSRNSGEKHIAAIESDMGGFLPLGFYYDTNNETALKKLMSWKKYFEPYQASYLDKGLPVFDIVPLKDDNILLLGLMANLQKYGSIYHTEKDVFEIVDKRELELGAAAMASMVYLIDKYGID
jgi:hypothetical protein